MDILTKKENRKCKECGKPISGRIDKMFCSNECKSAFNNIKNRVDRSVIKKINKILEQNRNIILKMNPGGKRKTTKESMIKLGYNFTYFTHQIITGKGNVYHFCYDYGYMQLDEEKMLLVKNIYS